MNNHKVSIVIPTFNRAKYLKQCIESALAQTIYCEIVVSDHGSTDNTPEVAESFGNRIKYLRRDVDNGVHYCWLDGVINCTGDLVHLNFDDDWIEPNFIEECLNLFNDKVGFVFSNVKIYLEENSEFNPPIWSPIFGETGLKKFKKLEDFTLYGSILSPGCTLIRKNDILNNLFVGKVPFSDFEYKGVGPDILITLMLSLQYEFFGYVDKPLSIFRAHSGSITVNSMQDQAKLENIYKAYDQSRIYFLLNKFVKRFLIIELLSIYLKGKRYFKHNIINILFKRYK